MDLSRRCEYSDEQLMCHGIPLLRLIKPGPQNPPHVRPCTVFPKIQSLTRLGRPARVRVLCSQLLTHTTLTLSQARVTPTTQYIKKEEMRNSFNVG